MGSFESKPQLTPQEQAKAYKREIGRAVRELDREVKKLEVNENKLKETCKKDLRENKLALAKQHAKDLVRTRKSIERFYSMKAQMSGVELQLQTITSTEAMVSAVRNATKAMSTMAKRMNNAQMTGILMDFAKQSDAMGMTQEIMDDTVDGVFGSDDVAGEEDSVLAQLQAEMQMTGASAMGRVPVGGLGGAAAVPGSVARAPGARS